MICRTGRTARAEDEADASTARYPSSSGRDGPARGVGTACVPPDRTRARSNSVWASMSAAVGPVASDTRRGVVVDGAVWRYSEWTWLRKRATPLMTWLVRTDATASKACWPRGTSAYATTTEEVARSLSTNARDSSGNTKLSLVP